MDRPGFGLRRLTGLLLVLNLGVLAGGLGVRFWPAPPESMLEFNADKVRLLGSVETAPSSRHGAPDPSPAVVSAAGAPYCLNWPSLDADKLAITAEQCRKSGAEQVETFAADLTDGDAVHRMAVAYNGISTGDPAAGTERRTVGTVNA